MLLNNKKVSTINSRLLPRPERQDPKRLAFNIGRSFEGSKIWGPGFILTPEERDTLIAKDNRNAKCIFPYIGGKEVNTSPTQDFRRYVINFGDMSLEEASEWPDLINIVRDKVKPERDRCRVAQLKKYWWQYASPSKSLYRAIQGMPRCLVTAQITKHLCFSFQPVDRVISQKLIVFPFDTYARFSILQSRLHDPWTRLLSSTMRDSGINYSNTDCFETFPFPDTEANLEGIGKQLYETRSQYMVDTDQGLTKTYNALKDPSCNDPRVMQLRTLHEEMDRAVLAAYGWDDITVPRYGEHNQDFIEEVIDRLYDLNGKRCY